jgi:predicted CopG family antitoxin
MPHKTVSISEEAYNKIVRITGHHISIASYIDRVLNVPTKPTNKSKPVKYKWKFGI